MGEPPDVMRMLRDGVPLTLLIDLLDVHGFDSRTIAVTEAGDASWLPLRAPAAADVA